MTPAKKLRRGLPKPGSNFTDEDLIEQALDVEAEVLRGVIDPPPTLPGELARRLRARNDEVEELRSKIFSLELAITASEERYNYGLDEWETD